MKRKQARHTAQSAGQKRGQERSGKRTAKGGEQRFDGRGEQQVRNGNQFREQQIHTGKRSEHQQRSGKKFDERGEQQIHTGKRSEHQQRNGKKFDERGEQQIHTGKRSEHQQRNGKKFDERGEQRIRDGKKQFDERGEQRMRDGKQFGERGEQRMRGGKRSEHRGEHDNRQKDQQGKQFVRREALSSVHGKAPSSERTIQSADRESKLAQSGKQQAQRKGNNNNNSNNSGGRAAVSEDIYEKNALVTANIVGLTHDGDGVGRTEQGYTLFIPHALPGEEVEAKVLKSKKQYGYGKMISLQKTSEHRIDPPCPIYAQCGGCQLQHYSYEEQLKWKRQHVIDSLTRIGKLKVKGEQGRAAGTEQASPSDQLLETVQQQQLDQQSQFIQTSSSIIGDASGAGASYNEQHEVIVHPTIGMDEPWHYRNKAALPIGASPQDGQLIGGFYAKGSHRIIDMDVCLIQKQLNDEVIAIAKQIARELRIEPYHEESATGVLRHMMTRVGVVTGEVMIVLITNTATLPRKAEWIEQLRKRVPNLKSIVHNVNGKVTNAIFGERTEVLWGSEVIYDELDGLRFAISARSFYQVNPEQTVALYRKAVEYSALTGSEQVIDAYCGIGTISLFLARQAAHVYGVEIVPEAIEDAKRNAALNDLDNTTFEAGPAEVVIPRWKQEGMNADVIVVDPPRKGCDPALLSTILAIRPERVVYVSCNPSTLARDLRVLEDGGYRTVEVTPVDMFPHTGHVECVIGICRVDT